MNTLAAGTHKINITYPVPAKLTRLYVEVDNDVTLSDNLNLVQGVGGGNSLALESIFDPPMEEILGISPICLTVVTTVSTKIAIYSEIETLG